MSDLIIKYFIDGEFHYRDSYKRSKLVDLTIRRMGGVTENCYLEQFTSILNSLIRREYICDAETGF